MCDFEKGFKLCTCAPSGTQAPRAIIHHKKSKRRKRHIDPDTLPREYIWVIFKHRKTIEPDEIGHYQMPRSNIGQGLTADWVLLNLNVENCFDFDYEPSEGDNLVIREPAPLSPRLSFIFRNGAWVEDHYDAFSEIIELHLRGIVKAFA